MYEEKMNSLPRQLFGKFRIVQTAGDVSFTLVVTYPEAVLSVVYRVRSQTWRGIPALANHHFRNCLSRPFVMERRNGSRRVEAWDRLFRRIAGTYPRHRASEKRFYKISRSLQTLHRLRQGTRPETHLFFQIVQNKLHFAVSVELPAEIITNEPDSEPGQQD